MISVLIHKTLAQKIYKKAEIVYDIIIRNYPKKLGLSEKSLVLKKPGLWRRRG